MECNGSSKDFNQTKETISSNIPVVPENYRQHQDLPEKTEQMKENGSQFQVGARELKLAIEIKNLQIITAASCCFFAPCTIPLICAKEWELEQLRRGPSSMSMNE